MKLRLHYTASDGNVARATRHFGSKVFTSAHGFGTGSFLVLQESSRSNQKSFTAVQCSRVNQLTPRMIETSVHMFSLVKCHFYVRYMSTDHKLALTETKGTRVVKKLWQGRHPTHSTWPYRTTAAAYTGSHRPKSLLFWRAERWQPVDLYKARGMTLLLAWSCGHKRVCRRHQDGKLSAASRRERGGNSSPSMVESA